MIFKKTIIDKIRSKQMLRIKPSQEVLPGEKEATSVRSNGDGQAESKPKLIICGTGRAGTTLLVRILTSAGIDTGFNRGHIERVEKNMGRAGLERRATSENSDTLPQVIKSPYLVDDLPELLSDNWFDIGLAIVPVRELEAAAQSRISVQEKAIAASFKGVPPGGMWKANSPEEQKGALAEVFYRTIEPLVAHQVPLILVSFPRFSLDECYFETQVVNELENRFGWSRKALLQAHRSECLPALISKPDGRE